MYRQCTSEKAALQQKQFEECLLSAMLRQSLDTITVSMLCRETGLSRKTFYRLYDSKGDVLFALMDHTFLLSQSFTPDASVGRGGMHHFFAFWKSQKRLLDALDQNAISALLMQRAIAHVFREESDILYCFGVDPSGEGREVLLFFLSGLFTLVSDWHKHGFERSIDDMSKLAMDILTSPPIKHPRDPDPFK